MQTVAECRLALRQLKHILGDVRRDKLSDNRFDEAHELFERSSDQQNLILDWLIAYCVQHAATDPYRLLSVGCGSGILDNPLLNALADLDREILYTGIDPNAVACERFRKNFMRSESPSIELTVRQESVETISCDQQFDIVQVVHALYYFDDPAATITELLSRIAEGGKLLVFQAPRAELNQLAECFWFHHQEADIWFSEELEEHLNDAGLPYSCERLQARVDVSRCFDPDCSQGQKVLDFITQVNCQELTPDVRLKVLDYLSLIAHHEDGSVLVPHPVDVYAICAPSNG